MPFIVSCLLVQHCLLLLVLSAKPHPVTAGVHDAAAGLCKPHATRVLCSVLNAFKVLAVAWTSPAPW